MDHDLTLRPTGRIGSRGEQYEVLFEGAIIAASASPEFQACRALQDRGLTGHARFWRAGKKHWDFRIDIAKGATRTVVEGVKGGPRFGKWSPYENSSDENSPTSEK